MDPRIYSSSKPVKARLYHSFFKGSFIFHKFFKAKEVVFTDLWNTVSHAFYFLRLFKTTRNGERSLQNEIDNPKFVDEEDIPLVNQDEEDYDDYKTLDTSRVDETSFIELDTTEAIATLRPRQKVK